MYALLARIQFEHPNKKLKFAKKFGATHIFNLKKNYDLDKYVRSLTSHKGADYTFDMVGNEQTQNLSIKIAKSGIPGFSLGGKIFFTGFPKGFSKIDTRNYRNSWW